MTIDVRTLTLWDFQAITIPFNAYRIKEGQCLWRNRTRSTDAIQSVSDQELVAQYAYMAPSRLQEMNQLLDKTQTVSLLAERYGGYGNAQNGGGVRCGIKGSVQIKGSGTNCLMGKGSEMSHSNGTLSLLDASLEVIYSEVLNNLLPLGTCPIYALIDISANCAISDHGAEGQLDRGALILREPALRPAHFLPSESFRPNPQYQNLLPPDQERVQALTQQLKHHCGDDPGVLRALSHFMYYAAAQMAYARVFGLCHGAMSNSNLCLDGRWLDVTCGTLVDNFKNYCIGRNAGRLAFNDEAAMPVDIATRLLWEYGKHHNRVFNPQPLIDYYKAAMKSHSHRFLGAMCGFSPDEINRLAQSDHYLPFANSLLRVISPTGRKLYWSPSTRHRDSHRICLLEYLALLALQQDTSHLTEEAAALFGGTAELKRCAAHFVHLCETLQEPGAHSLNTSITARLLCALRRAHLSSYFYRDRTLETLKDILWRQPYSPSALAAYIDHCINLSSWALAGEADDGMTLCLLQTDSLVIRYNCHHNRYLIQNPNDGPERSEENVAGVLASLAPSLTDPYGYLFAPYLAQFDRLVSRLSAHQQGGQNPLATEPPLPETTSL